jgi:hypothetical protein
MTTQPVERGWVGDDYTFGARLAIIRQRMQWGNVREAAIACGLPAESWRGWERDNRLPRDYMAICSAISQRCGCDLTWLLGVEQARELGTRPARTRPNKRAENRCTPPWSDSTGAAARRRPIRPTAEPLPLAKAS